MASKQSLFSISFVCLAFLALCIQPVHAFWTNLLSNKDTEPLVQVRLAGLQGDRSKIQETTQLLQNPPGIKNTSYAPGVRYHDQHIIHDFDIDNYYRKPLMHALAQLGAMGAVSALDDIIQTNKDDTVVMYAKICKARLLAESAIPHTENSRKQLGMRVERLLAELDMTPESVNTGVSDYVARAEVRHHQPLIADGNRNYLTLEVLALSEIADMVYQARAGSANLPPFVAKLDFSKDVPSALKVRLAPLSHPQRIDALVQELGAETVQQAFDECRMQLLCDEGTDTRAAIARRIQQFRADPSVDQAKFNTSRARDVLSEVYCNIDSGAPATTHQVALLDGLMVTGQAHPLRKLFAAMY